MKKSNLILFVVLALLTSCEQDIPVVTGSRTLKIDGLEYEMIFIQTNGFEMGATSEQSQYADANAEYPVHSVQLSSYYIGVHEVTQALWKTVMGDSLLTADRQVLGLSESLPVHNISWKDANTFVTRLAKITGERFTLPTEAEWEYAARGGVQENVYSGSSILENVGWNGCSDVKKVKTKGSNGFGLFDMSGNVAEYCADWYGAYTAGNQMVPTGPDSGTFKVVRGGSVTSDATECRVSARRKELPDSAIIDCGFRLVLR